MDLLSLAKGEVPFLVNIWAGWICFCTEILQRPYIISAITPVYARCHRNFCTNHAKNTVVGRIVPFSELVSGIKTSGYAPASCHIAGIFRPLPGSRHSKINTACFCLQSYLSMSADNVDVAPPGQDGAALPHQEQTLHRGRPAPALRRADAGGGHGRTARAGLGCT